MDRRNIKIFKGKDGRLLAQIMQSENGEYEVWERERLNNMLAGNLHKRKEKCLELVAALGTANRIVARYNKDQEG
jgi:hypothetical protein